MNCRKIVDSKIRSLATRNYRKVSKYIYVTDLYKVYSNSIAFKRSGVNDDARN